MIRVEIREAGCRGCQMCVDVCPTDVFVFLEAEMRAVVQDEENCIGCLSCAFDCPSGAVTHADVPLVKNFYRDLEFQARMERFL